MVSRWSFSILTGKNNMDFGSLTWIWGARNAKLCTARAIKPNLAIFQESFTHLSIKPSITFVCHLTSQTSTGETIGIECHPSPPHTMLIVWRKIIGCTKQYFQIKPEAERHWFSWQSLAFHSDEERIFDSCRASKASMPFLLALQPPFFKCLQWVGGDHYLNKTERKWEVHLPWPMQFMEKQQMEKQVQGCLHKFKKKNK